MNEKFEYTGTVTIAQLREAQGLLPDVDKLTVRQLREKLQEFEAAGLGDLGTDADEPYCTGPHKIKELKPSVRKKVLYEMFSTYIERYGWTPVYENILTGEIVPESEAFYFVEHPAYICVSRE